MATSKRRKQTAGTPNPAVAPEQAANSPAPAEDMALTQPAALAVNNTANLDATDDRGTMSAAAPADETTAPSATAAAPASPDTEDSALSDFATAQPATSVSGTSGYASPAAERAAFMRRRALGAAGAVVLLAAAAFLGSRLFASPSAPAPALADAATVTPAAQAATATPVAAQAATATAALAAQAAPTAAPAAATNPTAAPVSGLACSAIAHMPVYSGATCTKQDSDTDDGVVKLETTYVSSATADEIRRFYEGAFAQNGWTLGNFKYDVNAGQRRLEVEVETDQGVNGAITKVQLTEHGAAAPAGTTCAPIAGLPALPNATCTKFDTDHDDGVIKVKNTYTTTESSENIWRLFESALAQSGWAGREFQYGLQQGQTQVEVKVEAQQDVAGGATFQIAQK